MIAALVCGAALLLVPCDYQCGDDAGCKAQIVEDGELQEVTFRKGDMVNTGNAGWIVSTEDGWVKVNTSARTGGPRGRPKLGLTIGEVMLWTPTGEAWLGTYSTKAPTNHATFLRPAVSLAAQPPSVCLIGL